MSNAETMAQKRERRKAAGLCTECEEPHLPGKPLCARHDDMQQARMAKYNGKRKANNLCFCGNPREVGRDRCRECLDLENAKQQDRAAERMEQHWCRICGKRKVKPPLTVCESCRLNRQEEYHAQSRHNIKKRLRELVQCDRLPLPARLQSMARLLIGKTPTIEVGNLQHWRPREGAIRRYMKANPEFEGFVIVSTKVKPNRLGELERTVYGAYLVTRTKVTERRERIDIRFIPTTTEVPWEQYG